jgi:L-ascorbate metabolism protein UlaG (beta-lactamase superfamily)
MPRKKRMTGTAAVIAATSAAAAVGAIALARCAFSAPRYRGPRSDHFDGERFRNAERVPDHGFPEFIRWIATRERGSWPSWMINRTFPPPPERVEGNALRLTWVNHSSMLIQTAGLNILTDPIWSLRCSPSQRIGPRRHRAPGIDFDQLPPIDAVIVSHNHYDHLDIDTLERLAAREAPLVITGLGNALLLRQHGIVNVRELDWWESQQLGDATVHAVPARHFSGRGLCDRDATLWCGFVLATPGGPVYFAGDTGYGSHFEQIRERFGPPRLALLPIGAFRPRWFMEPAHISPEEAVRAHETLGAKTSVPMHYATFPLGDDGALEPRSVLESIIASQKELEGEFAILDCGEGVDVP